MDLTITDGTNPITDGTFEQKKEGNLPNTREASLGETKKPQT
jgi:hypothetical protein